MEEQKVPQGGLISQNAALERERLVSLINSMADGVLAVDQYAHVVLYNGAALNILDSNHVVEGENVSELIKLIDKNNQPIDITNLVTSTKTNFSSRDYRLIYPNDDHISLYISIAPVRLGYGSAGQSGFVILLRDITREKSLEEERDEFISVISHELRTPIAIAEGNISNARFIVDKTGDISRVKEALRSTYEQIQFLSGMINDLSTLSRAERGKLQVEIDEINAHNLILDLQKDYTKTATDKGLELKIELDPSLSILRSSKLYVREILQNFITNSIKYTQSGWVSIGATQEQNGVTFTIQDSGIGISKSDQEKVFDKFFRSEDYRTKQSSGTGLGLYVTMKLARMLNAEIDLESEINIGSTFTIKIPNLQ